jgi:hypothetical protein
MDLTVEKVIRISNDYNYVSKRLETVCKCIKEEAWRGELPGIPQYSLWNFRHGEVDYDTWGIIPASENEGAKIMVAAWNGNTTEPFDNSSVMIPFEFINMDEDELLKLLRGETDEHCQDSKSSD